MITRVLGDEPSKAWFGPGMGKGRHGGGAGSGGKIPADVNKHHVASERYETKKLQLIFIKMPGI